MDFLALYINCCNSKLVHDLSKDYRLRKRICSLVEENFFLQYQSLTPPQLCQTILLFNEVNFAGSTIFWLFASRDVKNLSEARCVDEQTKADLKAAAFLDRQGRFLNTNCLLAL